MIQLTYIREHYGVILPDWKSALGKAQAYLIRENRNHPANEDIAQDLKEIEIFISRYDANKYTYAAFNTLRLDDMEDELYDKDYKGSLQELLRKGE